MSNKRVKELIRAKAKAQKAGNLKEEARVCGQLGEEYTEDGRHEDSLHERRCELAIFEALSDQLRAAKAHRMIGECLCSLEDYNNALKHQREHLRISKQLDNLVEQQRALATIGRTLFMCSEQADSQTSQKSQLTESLQAYLSSLEVCDELEDVVGKGELLEMKGRLYLNIGVDYEAQKDLLQAQRFLEQSCRTLKDTKDDTLVLCHLSLGSVLNRQKKFEPALDSYRTALQVAKQLGSKEHQLEALEPLGTILNQLGRLTEGRKMLQQAYRQGRNDPSCDITNIRRQLVRATKLLRLQEQVKAEGDAVEMIKMHDKMGDLCHSMRAHQAAISHYQEELKLVEQSRGDVKPVLVSLAMSHSDVGDYETALYYYEQELPHCHGNPQEESVTWTAIARLRDDAGHDHNVVMTAYQRALSLAKMAENNKQKFLIYQHIRSYCNRHGYHDDAVHAHKEMEKLRIKETSVDDESSGSGSDDSSDVTLSSSEEGNVLRRHHRRATKVDRRNEKGETPLHVAAIAGNAKLVKQLIKKGAHVNTRDNCGWLPLHEACNYGNLDVVKVLLEHGAAVNDPGGVYCDGLTPLHDAAVNGQDEVVQLLLEYGADATIVDKEGRTPLDMAMEMYGIREGNYEEVMSLLRAAGSVALRQSSDRTDASSGGALVAMPTSPGNSKAEWLIDDMPTTRKKRKASHDFLAVSRKRSCDAVTDEGDYPNCDEDLLFVEGTYPNDDTLLDHDDVIDDMSVSSPACNIGDVIVTTGNQLNIIRVMVKIESHTFLVPCDPTSTIGWLCTVVGQRHAALDGRHPQVSLRKQNGALLANEDLVTAVINNEECVDAHVMSWTTPPLVDVYTNTSSGDVNQFVVQRLKNISSSSNAIDLSNCRIRISHFVTIVKCLANQPSLTTLCLRGNRLSCSVACLAFELPNLTTLDLSACGLSHVHLTPGGMGSLRHLSLGHNMFGADRAVALATYLMPCTALEQLSLTDCSLDHVTCLLLWQAIAKMEELRHLDLSYNFLNEAICQIPISSHLDYINMTATVSHDPSPLVSLLEGKLCDHSHLGQLIVQGCFLGDTQLIKLTDTFQTLKSLTALDLTNNNVTMETISYVKLRINHTVNITM